MAGGKTGVERKLRGGMVGGGPGAFIGPVHRIAATMDGKAEIIAGVFSSNPLKSREFGELLLPDSSRVYEDYKVMAEKEGVLTIDKRIDFVSIVTPNSTHASIAREFVERGITVFCDKPVTGTLQEAKQLSELVRRNGSLFFVTYNFTGYPMVKQARSLIRAGELGNIIKVMVEYQQGWMSDLLVEPSKRSFIWRLNPEIAGKSSTMADIGTHAENLMSYITGLKIEELSSELGTFIPGVELDVDGTVLIRFEGGAKGVLSVSQVCSGEQNGLRIRVYGTRGGLAWSQEDPNILTIMKPDGSRIIQNKGGGGLCLQSQFSSRLPSGQPEGFIEAFANFYIEGFKVMRASKNGEKLESDICTIEEGIRGVAFVEAVLRSYQENGEWVKLQY